MKKTVGSLIILAMLSGCWCGIEEQDPSGVGDYFSGCWTAFKGEKPRTVKIKNNTDDINEEK
jgi:hypothetical protein